MTKLHWLFSVLIFCHTTAFAQSITEMPAVLQLPGMEKVEVRSQTYKSINDTTLRIDVYYPPNLSESARLPVVIFNNGVGSMTLPEWRGYQDWARMVAVSNLIGVHYQSRRDHAREDSEDLIDYVRQNAETLKIDATRIGMFTSSANVYVGLPLAMQEERDYIRCVAIYYGIENSKPTRQDLRLLIVRAGLDSYALNRNIDRFVHEALNRDLDIELINYLQGQHAFDILDDTDRSRQIIRQTLDFFKLHLNRSAAAQPFVLTAKNFYTMVVEEEFERAKRLYRETVQKYQNDPSINLRFNRAVSEGSLNQIGYQLMDEQKQAEAIAVFEFAIETYPDSPNAYDSMADAYEAAGNIDLAIEYAEKALRKLETAENIYPSQKERIRESATDKLNRLRKN